MTKLRLFKAAFSILLLLIVFPATYCVVGFAAEREIDFNFGWKFELQKDSELNGTIPLNDSNWRDVRLPHDWSVEASFDPNLEGCTGYLPGGVAWYQKHFATPKDVDTKKVYILFDGVYNNAKFWLNGQLLGENPYGYSAVYFDLTDTLTQDGTDNVISVHVDHSRYADGRWYTGSGIYRNVKLILVNKLHIPIWGTFVTTPEVSAEKAVVRLATKVVNERNEACRFTLDTTIVDSRGRTVSKSQRDANLSVDGAETFEQELQLANPELWDTESPHMYRAVTKIIENEKMVDEYRTPFGVRSLLFDKSNGFCLNGKPTFVKGVCLHHDGGLVGAAVPEGVWRRRLQILKDAGCNAIRTAHNPFSEEFLDLCDEMGFLVQNEFFDEWDYPKDKRLNYHDRHDDYITRGYTEHFQKWAKSDLTRTMLRDRNHPSVFQWSIGNEIEWTYLHYRYVTGFWKDPKDPQNSGAYWGSLPQFSPKELKQRYNESPKGEYVLSETAERLNGWVKELDATRPTTANLVIPHISHVSGYADAVDFVGYSYRNIEIGWSNKHFPHKQVTINECPGTWDDWKQVLEWPGVFSIFMWTGIDYLGEAHAKWPQKGWDGDMLDFAGFRKQGWNYFKSVWKNEPHLSLGTLPIKGSKFTVDDLSGKPEVTSATSVRWRNSNMHWNYEPGEMVMVEVCTNLPVVELLLNGRTCGFRSLSECPDRLLRWAVPFEPGELVAKAGFNGGEVTARLATTSEPVRIILTADKTMLSADGYDVSHIVAQLVDKDDNDVKTTDVDLKFIVEGNVKILGVDNGSNHSVQDYQADHLQTNQGRALLLLQSKRTEGEVSVSAQAENLESNTIKINIAS